MDFLTRSAVGETELIQVCADASHPTTSQRELRWLVEAGKSQVGNNFLDGQFGLSDIGFYREWRLSRQSNYEKIENHP